MDKGNHRQLGEKKINASNSNETTHTHQFIVQKHRYSMSRQMAKTQRAADAHDWGVKLGILHLSNHAEEEKGREKKRDKIKTHSITVHDTHRLTYPLSRSSSKSGCTSSMWPDVHW